MQILNIEQGSLEWFETRQKYYKTASRTPIVMGVSPFSNKEQLANEIKTGRSQFQNKSMLKGIELEQRVREMASLELDEEFQPCVGVEGEYLASLDGLNFNKDLILEIKVSEKTCNDLKNGIVPENYFWQTQHQMGVFGVKFAWLVAYSPEIDKILKTLIGFKPAHWEAIKKAWDEFDLFLSSYEPKSEERITEERIVAKAYDLEHLIAEKEALENHILIIKQELMENITRDKTIIGNLSVIRSKGRESWDYKKFLLDNNLTIPENYKKTGEAVYQFRFSK